MSTHFVLHDRALRLQLAILLLGGLLIGGFSTTVNALTFEEEVTPAYVSAHPEEWSVKSVKQANGLVHFTINRKLAEPKFLVAQLGVHHAGKLIATSDTPLYGRVRENTFHFALVVEDIAGSTFAISESALSSTDGGKLEAVPIVGSIIHRFQLKDFLPEKLLKPGQ